METTSLSEAISGHQRPHHRAIELSAFRGRVERGARFAPASGRYHLYASYACPFAQRTLIARSVAGLDAHVGASILHPRFESRGWTFDTDFPDTTGDRLAGHTTLRAVYRAAARDFAGRATTPVLWDVETSTIVSNDSAEIASIFLRDFEGVGSPARTIAPPHALDAFVSSRICEGVYRVGFARTQHDYEAALDALLAALEHVDAALDGRRFLGGSHPSETDIKLVCTLLRWDSVYAIALKCGARALADFPALQALTLRMAALPEVADTVRMDHVWRHYFDDWPQYVHTIVPRPRWASSPWSRTTAHQEDK